MSCFSCIFKRKQASVQQPVLSDEVSGIENVRLYSYEELNNATREFSIANKVGEGGFGPVYRGTLRDGRDAAIKMLSIDSRQGAREFLNELITISNADHENLVKLYGCCVEGDHRILVYNYLVNNSLSQTLFGANRSNIQFNWKTRVKICIGVARGLAYLHEEVQPHIVHRDIKASNILLDWDLTPKISDFGLAKLLPDDMTHVSTRVAGTLGYLAPEYAMRGQVTRKSDVYSFGVLLLEIVSGRCNNSMQLPIEEQSLLEKSSDIMHGLLILQTWALYEQRELSKIIDSSLIGDLDTDEACKFLKVGLLCTQDAVKLRPTMPTVVSMLTGERDVEFANIMKPGVAPDFKALKIRKKKKSNQTSTSSSTMSSGTFPMSSVVNTNATMTFTSLSERD